MKKRLLSLLCVSILTSSSFTQTELISNGGFETGDLTGWTVAATNGVDAGPASCTENWRVQDNSADLCCCVLEVVPTEGTMAAYTSFDSDVALTDWMIEQTVTLPAASLTAASVAFDFKGNINFDLVGMATIPRELSVDFYTTGGTFIANVFSDSTFIAVDSVNIDYSQNVDVLSSLAGLQGTNIVLRFTASVPEAVMGPGKALIDAVSFMVTESSSGLDEVLTSSGFSYFPNPANNVLNINAEVEIDQIDIYDMVGKLIMKQTIGSNNAQLNISKLVPGSYIIKAFNDNGELGRHKFTKK